MKRTSYLTTLFALLLLLGGLAGYLFANSTASLVSSSIFAFLFLLASLALFNNRSWGNHLALALSLLLVAFFAYRYTQTQGFMPMTMGILSAIFAAYLTFIIIRQEKI